MRIEQIRSMTKQQQFALLKAVRPFLDLTIVEVAREADVSPALVNYVFQGVNSNEKVLAVIFNNLKPGYETAIPSELLEVA